MEEADLDLPVPDVTIVVVNWNTRDLLAQCLTSIFSSIGDVSGEVIVVDNASADGSAAMVREQFRWARLIENAQNQGFARANNRAIEQSRGRYVLLLNSDAFLKSHSLSRLLEFADSKPRAGVIGVKLLNKDDSFQASLNDFPTLSSTLLEPWMLPQLLSGNRFYPSYPPQRSQVATPCDWVGGACLLVRRSAIEEVGLLDEDYFMNSEETDWCYRMRQTGWEVWYTPDVEVVHLGGGSADRLDSLHQIRLYESKIRFLRKHRGRAAPYIARFNYRVSCFVKALVYEARFLITRDQFHRRRARSHWIVAMRRKWA